MRNNFKKINSIFHEKLENVKDLFSGFLSDPDEYENDLVALKYSNDPITANDAEILIESLESFESEFFKNTSKNKKTTETKSIDESLDKIILKHSEAQPTYKVYNSKRRPTKVSKNDKENIDDKEQTL